MQKRGEEIIRRRHNNEHTEIQQQNADFIRSYLRTAAAAASLILTMGGAEGCSMGFTMPLATGDAGRMADERGEGYTSCAFTAGTGWVVEMAGRAVAVGVALTASPLPLAVAMAVGAASASASETAARPLASIMGWRKYAICAASIRMMASKKEG